MLTYDSKYEVEFDQSVVPHLTDVGVTVVAASYVPSTSVLDIVLQLPEDADLRVRREALGILSDFEHRFDYAVITDAAFVWAQTADC